jgi:2,3-bisphosphoglycerate-independent phosphoglycerate mutase
MRRSEAVLAASAANRARDMPATGIWLWGLGRTPQLTPFAERFGKTAAVITAVDLLRGIGALLGWKIIHVPGATGYLDTDYAAKGRYAIRALDEVDLIVVHVEATDEASHEGDAFAKVQALERIDCDVVAPLHAHLESRGEYRLLICPDHPTFLRTKTHSHGYCPFAICGSGVAADEAASYDEPTAAASALVLPHGHELMGRFLNAECGIRHAE